MKYDTMNVSLINPFSELMNIGIALGNNCYKIRISIASKGQGKSGGARGITHFYVTEKSVFLLSIYDKTDQENIQTASSEHSLAKLNNPLPNLHLCSGLIILLIRY